MDLGIPPYLVGATVEGVIAQRLVRANCVHCAGEYKPAPDVLATFRDVEVPQQSLEVLHLIALTTGAGGIADFGVQRFRYVPGILDQRTGAKCHDGCDRSELIGHGDRHFTLMGPDLAAASSRQA